MNILQLIQKSQLRGAEMFAGQLSVELAQNGNACELVCLFAAGDGLKAKFPTLRFNKLQGKQTSRLVDVSAYKRLAELISSGNYDIVQANAGDTLKYAALSKLIFGWKAKLVYRNANKMSAFLRNGVHRMFIRFLLGQCDQVISVSENCRVDIVSILPALKNKAVTIPIGTYDFTDTQPFPRTGEGPVWINVGAFVPEKNHSFLIDIFAAHVRESAKGLLWLVGDGPLMEIVRKKVVMLGLTDRVTFYGARRDAVALLKSADVLVMPSKIEGLPGVILEAFSCGTPVVASGVGGIPEVIENGVTGFCLADFSVASYLDNIRKILVDQQLRKTIIANAKQRVERDYTMPVIATRFMKVYEKILQA